MKWDRVKVELGHRERLYWKTQT